MDGGGMPGCQRAMSCVRALTVHQATCQPPNWIMTTHTPLQVTGVLQHVDYLKPWQSNPEVLYARPLVQVRSKARARWCSLRGRKMCEAWAG